MRSENKNFLFNTVYQLLTFIIPLITTPYISRVLGVENVGIYSYTYSVVYMFMLAGMLGINNYGNRSIAAVRDDKEQMSRSFASIYLLQLGVCLVALIGYSIYLVFFCKEYKTIAVIQGLFLLSVCFDINWFYFGIEKFKLTIFRNLIIKLSSLALIFIFVKTRYDLPIYTFIMAGATLFSQLCLAVILPRYVVFVRISIKDITSHIKGVLVLFIPVLAFGIYKVMDKTMLGTLSNVTELGFYENAEKLLNIPLAVVTALGTVMLPRMSYLVSVNDNGYRATIEKSMTLAMKMSTVMCCGLILIANEVVVVLFGTEFLGSAGILKLLAITLLASAWANVIRTQYLIPLKKDRTYIFSTLWAAVLNFILNAIFIKKLGGVGACIGTIAAEYFVALYQTVATRKELYYKIFLNNALDDFMKSIGMVVVAYFLTISIANDIYRLLGKILISIVLFIALNRTYIVQEFFGIKQK